MAICTNTSKGSLHREIAIGAWTKGAEKQYCCKSCYPDSDCDGRLKSAGYVWEYCCSNETCSATPVIGEWHKEDGSLWGRRCRPCYEQYKEMNINNRRTWHPYGNGPETRPTPLGAMPADMTIVISTKNNIPADYRYYGFSSQAELDRLLEDKS